MCAKNYEKLLRVDKVVTTNTVYGFLAHSVFNSLYISVSRGFPWAGTANDIRRCQRRLFSAILVATSSKTSDIAYGKQYYMTICYPCPPASDSKIMTLNDRK